MSSDTLAPVLNISVSNKWSRCPSQVVVGTSITASICSRVRKPTILRSKRFIGTASARSMTFRLATSRRAANFRNERSAARRMLRLRGQLPRSRSRWSRKFAMNFGSRSANCTAAADLPMVRSAKRNSSTKLSR